MRATFPEAQRQELPFADSVGEALVTARGKLVHIHSAIGINDLRVPPGNRLELLKGKLKGRHSIRINDQWRIVFRWHEGNAFEVEITDYH